MDYRTRQIIIYGVGSIVIALWAVFRIIPYSIAMLISAVILSIALVVEAEEARVHRQDRKHHLKIFLAMGIIILCIILIIFEYA